jgi:hypothetical protein
VELWAFAPGSPLIPVSERPSAVTRPARSKLWLSEPAVPTLIPVGRSIASYERVSVRLDGKLWPARRPSRRWVRSTLPATYVSGGSTVVVRRAQS